MQLNTLHMRPYSLDLARQLTTARDTTQSRHGIIVAAEADLGLFGFGDAAPIAGFNPETLEKAADELVAVSEALSGIDVPDKPEVLAAFLEELRATHSLSSSTVFAIESALADLASQQEAQALSKWYNPKAAETVEVNTLLSGESEGLLERARDARAFGFRTFKLKLSRDPVESARNVRSVREALAPEAKLRLDANQAYTPEDARRFLHAVEDLDIEYVEEPLKVPLHSAIKALGAETSVRIALDESLVNAQMLDACLSDPVCGVFVLKPMSMGGILRTLEVASQAKDQGIETVITTSLESAVGVTACIHTAAALGRVAVAHGLSTESLYRDSFGKSRILASEGKLSVPSQPGLGREFVFPREWKLG